jgi:hypothetical protein
MVAGIPNEEVLTRRRQRQSPVYYLVGTPTSRLGSMQAALAEQPWQAVREGVEVKLRPLEGELYVLARSRERRHKEQAIRRRQLKRLWQRLNELQQRPRLTRDTLFLKLGAAIHQFPAAWRLIAPRLPRADEAVNAETCHFRLRKKQLPEVLRREGRCLLRTNLSGDDPPRRWSIAGTDGEHCAHDHENGID